MMVQNVSILFLLKDDFKTQLPVDQLFRPVPAGFCCSILQPDGTDGHLMVGFWSRPLVNFEGFSNERFWAVPWSVAHRAILKATPADFVIIPTATVSTSLFSGVFPPFHNLKNLPHFENGGCDNNCFGKVKNICAASCARQQKMLQNAGVHCRDVLRHHINSGSEIEFRHYPLLHIISY